MIFRVRRVHRRAPLREGAGKCAEGCMLLGLRVQRAPLVKERTPSPQSSWGVGAAECSQSSLSWLRHNMVTV